MAGRRDLQGRLRAGVFGLTMTLTLALSGLYLLVSDRTAWGEYFTIWPPFFWLLGLIPLAMIGSDRRHLRRSLLLPISLLCLILLTTEWRPLLRFHGREIAVRKPDSLRLATWNVNSGSGGWQAYLNKLASLDPDLVFMQETPDGTDSLQPEDLRGHWEGFHWWDDGDCGLLSRHPLQMLDSERIGPWSLPQMALIEPTSGTRILLVNVRLMLPSLMLNPLAAKNRRRLTDDHRIRLMQFEQLAGLIERTMKEHGVDSAILAGDFNTPGRMASLRPLRRIMSDAWLVAGQGWGATMTQDFPVSRLDQCWVTGSQLPDRAWVLDGAPSDHRLLMVDLVMTPEK